MYADFMKMAMLLPLIFSVTASAVDLSGRWFGNGYYKNSVLGSHPAQVYMEFNQTPAQLHMSVCWKFVKDSALWTVCDRWNYEVKDLEIWWYGRKVGELNKSGFFFAYSDDQVSFTSGNAELKDNGRLDFFYEDHDSAGRETKNFVEGLKRVN
jgi:hypothetical protein